MKTRDELIEENSELRRRLKECQKQAGRQKEAERALRKSEKQYRAVVEHQTELICRHRPDSAFTFANEAYCRAYGKSLEELLGKSFFPFLFPKTRRIVKKLFRELTPDNPDSLHIEEVLLADGELHWQQWSNHGIFDKRGRLIEIQSVGRDITELKKSEEALKTSDRRLRIQKTALEEKNIALREILEQIEIEKKQIKDDVVANIEELILPTVHKLKEQENHDLRACAELLEHNLAELTSSFGRKLSRACLKLSPREIEICNMIKTGLSSKDIARVLHLSLHTVETHRNTIRKKFSLINKEVNLTTFLQNL